MPYAGITPSELFAICPGLKEQSKGYSCWAASMSVLMRLNGINISEQVIISVFPYWAEHEGINSRQWQELIKLMNDKYFVAVVYHHSAPAPVATPATVSPNIPVRTSAPAVAPAVTSAATPVPVSVPAPVSVRAPVPAPEYPAISSSSSSSSSSSPPQYQTVIRQMFHYKNYEQMLDFLHIFKGAMVFIEGHFVVLLGHATEGSITYYDPWENICKTGPKDIFKSYSGSGEVAVVQERRLFHDSPPAGAKRVVFN